MAKTKRNIGEVDDYESDDFVENDDGQAPKAKKSKKVDIMSSSKTKSAEKPEYWSVSRICISAELSLTTL